jgi:hypothetical protein
MLSGRSTSQFFGVIHPQPTRVVDGPMIPTDGHHELLPMRGAVRTVIFPEG